MLCELQYKKSSSEMNSFLAVVVIVVAVKLQSWDSTECSSDCHCGSTEPVRPVVPLVPFSRVIALSRFASEPFVCIRRPVALALDTGTTASCPHVEKAISIKFARSNAIANTNRTGRKHASVVAR